MPTLIQNAIIVTESCEFKGDILICDEKISQVGTRITPEPDWELVDAEGKYAIPGGIDPHVHMQLPIGGGKTSSDSFESGGIAALFGGTTSIIDFVTPEKGQPLMDAFASRKKEADSATCDYAFHMSVTKMQPDTNKQLIECRKAGMSSCKLYTAYKQNIGLMDEEIFPSLEAIKEANMLPIVHCENAEIIEHLRDKAGKENRLSPCSHLETRPAESESEAVSRLIHLTRALDMPLYIVHVSAMQSVLQIAKARRNGARVFGETCPQYLTLEKDVYYQPGFQSAKYVLSPPIRGGRHKETLWNAIQSDTLQCLATDHCPFTLEQKKLGEHDFRVMPNGAGGVEHRMELLHHFGVNTGRISMSRFVSLTSTSAARLFGILPKKGALIPGADADIVLWNPKKKKLISSASHKQNCDLNIFEGITVEGCAETVFLRGKKVISETGEYNPVSGKYISRTLPVING
jgi:dihydropyrimidinase